jgi:hypothetical protein
MAERNPWFDPAPMRGPRTAPPQTGRSGSADDDPPSPWQLRPRPRTRWLLLREEVPIAELGVLSTGEWWICPVDEALPWAETYGSRGAATRAVLVWWLHTHPFPDG